MNEENKQEYEEYVNEQFQKLRDHFDRFVIRCLNKSKEIKNED